MTSTTQEWTDADFDAWSEEDEAKALEALKPQVKHIIVEKRFIGRFTDGVTVELPLSLSLDDINELSEGSDGPVDQVTAMLEKLGGPESAKAFTSHDLIEATAIAMRWTNVFQRLAGATVPE